MKKWRKWIATAMGVVMTASGIMLLPKQASAGFSNVIVDNASFVDGFNAAKWHVPNDDVLVENGKILFSKDSTSDTRLIATEPINDSGQSNQLFSADYTMKLKTLPADAKFILGFSLITQESQFEEAGNVEIVFENNSGIKISVLAYDNDGGAIVLAEAQSSGVSLGNNFKVSVKASTDNKFSVTVNGKTICNKVSPVDLSGRAGFLQTGGVEAEVSDVNIISYRYDTPENPNIAEDFESGSININALTSRAAQVSAGYYPAGVEVQEYNGSKVLMFENVNIGHIGTVYQYSNFEATFDVPYMLHESIVDENGNIVTPANLGLVFVIGSDLSDFQSMDSQEWVTAPEVLIFNSDAVYSPKKIEEGAFADFTKKEFYQKGTNDGYSVKVSVIDTIVTVSMKSLKATQFEEILSYKMGNTTPTGYVHIASNGRANFAIDNFNITNKDKNSKLIEVEYKSGKIDPENAGDWVYEPMEVKYRDTAQEEKGIAVEWFYITAGGLAVATVMVIVSAVVVARKKRLKNGGEANEKA